MNKIGETTMVLDLKALEHNYSFLQSKIDKKTKFLGVVKAFAYGSDMVTIAHKLQTLGADYLAVAYVKEGVLLRKAGIALPVLVLHPQPVNFETLIEHSLEPNLYSHKILSLFAKAAKKLDKTDYPVHLKFNTGLNRLGFSEHDVDDIMEYLKGKRDIKVISVFSHLAASEDLAERAFSLNQIRTFEKIYGELCEKLGYAPFRHILNTSGILNYPEAQFEMVRSGVGLYGYGNDKDIDKLLRPVAALKTIISQIHKIEAHESVGYNRAYASEENRTTATLPLGHADGIGRHYGNGRTYVSIGGKLAPIIGNVCMDMIMVDVTDIDCKEGDEVLVFGQGKSAEVFATSANTISYEILTAISPRVTRMVID